MRLYSGGDYNCDRVRGREVGGEGGGSASTYGKSRRGQRWQGNEERGTRRGDIRSVMDYLQRLGEREMHGERRWRLPSIHVLGVCC